MGVSRLSDELPIHTEYLDNKETKQFQSIQHPRRQREFAAVRLLLKKMAEQKGLKKLSIRKHEATGAPYGLVQGKLTPLSITHTREAVGGAISMGEHAIGIDIEWRDREVHSGLRSRLLHPEEQDSLTNINTLQLWTIKEAVSKLVKTGLTKNFNQICIKQEKTHTFSVVLPSHKTAQIIVINTDQFYLSLAYYK